MGIDPVTHKPFSHLMAEIATTLAPPQVAHLAEAALGCFKDEMLHLLTKKRMDFATGIPQPPPVVSSVDAGAAMSYYHTVSPMEDKEETIQNIKLGLSRAIMQEPVSADKGWGGLMMTNGEPSDGLAAAMCDNMYPAMGDGLRFEGSSYGNDGEGSVWSQSMCTGSTCTGGAGAAAEQHHCNELHEKHDGDDDGNEEEAEGREGGRKVDAGMFSSDCVLWDLSDDLMNPIV